MQMKSLMSLVLVMLTFTTCTFITRRYLYIGNNFELTSCPPDCRHFLSDFEFDQLVSSSRKNIDDCENICSQIMAKETSPILINQVCPSVCITVRRLVSTNEG
ncbi:uncharacterized protein LOC127879931 [Dreissena polymorpha]|uniref:uncharacterized protein LOC127879931 n=1 Tax=Dreissena polymorpha TaxID=45954 RepID=UPI0022650806|nr:uncharacterized protein LOC127879931 [Dreissena polymorpha]